jgi:hypothetical protein
LETEIALNSFYNEYSPAASNDWGISLSATWGRYLSCHDYPAASLMFGMIKSIVSGLQDVSP